MSIALWGLIGFAILALVHVSIDSFILKGSVGNAWTVGSRDTPPNASPLSGRAHRALWNLLETGPAFVALVIAAELSGRVDAWTSWGVGLYLVGRVAYLPAYLSGLPWIRTICWLPATTGIVLVLIGVLKG